MWRWIHHTIFIVYRLFAWSCLDSCTLTDLHLQIFELDLIADGAVGLSDVLGIDLIMSIFGVYYFGIGSKQIFIDVLIELLSGEGGTLILLILIL